MSDPLKFLELESIPPVSQMLDTDLFLVRKFSAVSSKFELKQIRKEDLITDLNLVPPGPQRHVQTLTVAAGTQRGQVDLGRCVVLLKIKSSDQARIRLYCNQTAADQDFPRNSGVFPTNSSGLMLEFIATSSILTGLMSPASVIYNLDTPTNPWLYYTVESATGVDIDFTYLEYEQ